MGAVGEVSDELVALRSENDNLGERIVYCGNKSHEQYRSVHDPHVVQLLKLTEIQRDTKIEGIEINSIGQ